MKKLFYILACFALAACNNNYQQPAVESQRTTSSDSYTPHYSSPKDAAPEIARTFVKRNFASDCKFEHDVVVETTMVSNRYQVMQKFKSNKQGVELTYVYKIFIQYFDGDVNDVSSWDFNQLVVEEVNNGKQTYFRGNLDSREKKSLGIGSTVEFNGIQFKITDARIGTALKFSHKGTLTRKQLGNALKEMHETYGYDYYHICKDSKPTEEYLSYHSKEKECAVFDYEHNKIYSSIETYIQGKSLY